MKRLQIRKWKILVCGILLLLLTGYAVSAKVWISRDNNIQTGGDVYRTGELIDREMNVFGNAATASGKTAVIAPGSKGCYTFTIQNTKDFPMEVCWQLSDENLHKIPMQYRLKVGTDYLYGSAKEWIAGEDLEKYLIEDQLFSGEQREYALDWEWPFFTNDEQDQRDTELGNLAAAEEDVKYQLCLSIRAEGDDNNNSGEDDNNSSGEEDNNSSGEDDNSGDKEPLDPNIDGETGSMDQSGVEKPEAEEQSGASNDLGDTDKHSESDKNNGETSETEQHQGAEHDAVEENGEIFDKGNKNEQQKIEVSALNEKDGRSCLWLWILLIIIGGMVIFAIRRWRKNSKMKAAMEEDFEENQ